MTRIERRQLEATVDYLVTFINSHLDPTITESVFKRYNARGTWDLSDNDLKLLFDELDVIAADI